MNLKETNTTLALVQAFDRRTVGEVDVRAWQSVLGDLEVADVMEAVRRHYADSSDWMMPAHVRRGVAEIVAERNRPEASPWAPGQHGVLREDAMPIGLRPSAAEAGREIERLALSDLPAEVAALVARVRADLPEGSREALKPRTVAWEREHAAFRRSQDGEPNPHYRPRPDRDAECPAPIGGKCTHPMDDPAHDPRYLDPEGGSNNVQALDDSDGFCVGGESCTHGGHRGATGRTGQHECLIKDGRCLVAGHVEAGADTGILPDAHRCADCTFVASGEALMRAHLASTGHVHE